MANVFLISDTHFGHNNILNFLKDDGDKLRTFASVEEMDELMVQNWNKTVKPKDKVYHLGDVAINRKCLELLSKLNGIKVLIKGNHDIFKLTDYCKYFKDIRAVHRLAKCLILSHIPIHEASIPESMYNIHGHLHYRRVLTSDKKIHPSYLNVSVELIDYTPISLECAIKKCITQF